MVAQSDQAHSLELTLRVQGREPTRGGAVLRRLDEGERARRARRAAGVCVAIGVGSIFIPIVHFVMPWLMLVVASLVYRHINNQRGEVHDARGPCPGCGADLALPVQPPDWPLEWNCPGCRKRVTFEPDASAAAAAGGG